MPTFQPPATTRFYAGCDLHARSLYLVILDRDFDRRQQLSSYARLCGAVQQSDGKRVGVGNRKAGNAWLKWAFSEAAVLSARHDERVGRLLERLSGKLGRAGGLSALAHKLARAFYHMLHTREVFDVNRFARH